MQAVYQPFALLLAVAAIIGIVALRLRLPLIRSACLNCGCSD